MNDGEMLLLKVSNELDGWPDSEGEIDMIVQLLYSDPDKTEGCREFYNAVKNLMAAFALMEGTAGEGYIYKDTMRKLYFIQNAIQRNYLMEPPIIRETWNMIH